MARCTSLAGFLIVVLAFLQVANAATRYTVGDSLGWTIPPNNSLNYYQEWANNKTFQIGDSVVFNWTGTHTATELGSKEDYDNCTKIGIVIVTSGVIVPFGTNGTRYFVCSVGTHCEQGMKVAIKVGNGISPYSAAPSLANIGALSAILSTIIVFFLSFA